MARPCTGPGHPRLARNVDREGSGGARPGPPEVVLDADDVVQFGRRNLDQLDISVDRFVAVDPPDRDAPMLARLEVARPDDAVGTLEMEAQTAAQDQEGLVLHEVLLERQTPARGDEQDLADVVAAKLSK